MDSVKWPMLFVCLCFRVTQTEASSWKVKVPSSVKGLPGSCVFIPCSFNYPDTDIRITEFLGMWFIAGGSSIIYHPDESKMIKEFQGRTELLGDVRQKNCSLKIDPLKSSDSGPFFFRIEMKGYDNGSYTEQTSITMMNAPVNVNVEHKSDVTEGEAVPLSCSCDAHPPASYQWHDETGAKLHDGNVYKLPNVSRHTGALFCTAINDIGQRKSNPVLLNVLYMPEIKTVSSCSSEAHMVKCVCIAESRPVSMIHFVLPDRVLPRVKVEQHGTVTIGTLHAEFGSSCVVLCVANNTLGNANITLSLPVNSTMQNLYIVIASGAAGILVTVLIAVSVFKKCKGKSANAQTRHIVPEKTDKDVALPHCSATKRKEKRYEDVHSADIFDNDHVYGNMETDCGDAIYANM
uniref:Ig-like domain-containing protein n=1 Tax=Gasterosteus aculeatus aculeatus TaxID=481459 RepID=G3NA79_GASAC